MPDNIPRQFVADVTIPFDSRPGVIDLGGFTLIIRIFVDSLPGRYDPRFRFR